MLIGFDHYMQETFNMHQHLAEMCFHPDRNIYVQCREFCMIYRDSLVYYYYRCADGYEEQEDLPPIEELRIR